MIHLSSHRTAAAAARNANLSAAVCLTAQPACSVFDVRFRDERVLETS
jgi:hypothetical protein